MNRHLQISLQLCAALGLALATSSCTSIRFDSQALNLERDLANDSLTVEITYHDIRPPEKTTLFGFGMDLAFGVQVTPILDVQTAAGFLKQVSAGERVFILATDWDLERATDSQDEESDSFIRGIRMMNARVHLGLHGELMAYQKLYVPDVNKGLTLLNRSLRSEVLKYSEDPETLEELSEIQANCLRIAVRDANAKADWITWGRDGLRVSIPLSSEHLLTLIESGAEELLQTESDQDLREAVKLIRYLTSSALRDFRVEGEHVVLYLGNDEGNLDLTDHDQQPDRPSESGGVLIKHLAEIGFDLPAIWTAKE